MAFVIEKGIPVHPKEKFPFTQMKVGDSFAFPPEMRGNVATRAHAYSKKTGNKFTIHLQGDVCRIWRTA